MKNACNCDSCRKVQEKRKLFKNNPFLSMVDELRQQTKELQLEKAVDKYTRPFNPDDWTGQELGQHAFQEAYDLEVYITGLISKVEKLEGKNQILTAKLNIAEKTIKELETIIEYWKLRALYEQQQRK